MPKNVDKEEVMNRIAYAVLITISQKGFREVSVRNVAKTANMKASTLRNYFPSQDDLLLYSINLTCGEMIKRMRAIKNQSPEKFYSREALYEFLPLDEARRIIFLAWNSFIGEQNNAQIQEIKQKNQRQQYDYFCQWITENIGENQSKAFALHSFIDGASLALLTDYTKENMQRVVRELDIFIDNLCK